MQSIPTADEMSTRWQVLLLFTRWVDEMSTRRKELLLLTSWLRTGKNSCRRRVPSANDHSADDPRQNELTKIYAIQAGRSETLA